MGAWAAFYVGDFAYFVLALELVFMKGGAAAVGAMVVVNALPGGLLAPLAAALATSTHPQRHLAISHGVRFIVAIATIAAALSGMSVIAIVALVGLDGLVSVVVRPVHGALVVRLADNPAETAAANAATSTLVSASALIGPALAGIVLRFVGIGWAFALPAGTFVLAAVMSACIRAPQGGSEYGNDHAREGADTRLRAMSAGFRAIADSRPAVAATALFFVSMILIGVWYVVSAPIAVDRLGLGDNGVTTIMTVYGAGGLVGALATLFTVGRCRALSLVLVASMSGIAVAIVMVGTTYATLPGLLLAAVLGVTGAVVYSIVPTLVQRSVASGSTVTAVASLQSLYLVGLTVGAMSAPLLISTVGLTATLAIVGGVAAAVTLAAWPLLRRQRHRDRQAGDDPGHTDADSAARAGAACPRRHSSLGADKQESDPTGRPRQSVLPDPVGSR